MTQKKWNIRSVVALVLMLSMLIGAIVAVGVTASADSSATGATTLPDDVEAWSGGTPSESLSGGGTAANPFLISNAADFVCFYNNAASADSETYYKLTADIYFAPTFQFPDTYGTNTGVDFAGVLDGDGHTVYNIRKSNYSGTRCVFGVVSGTLKNITFDGIYMGTGSNGVSAFGKNITSGAVIDNLHVKNMSLSGLTTSLFSSAYGSTSQDLTIQNVTVSGKCNSVGSNAAYLGGIIGRVDGAIATLTLKNITTDLDITCSGTNRYYLGGLIAGVGVEYNSNKITDLVLENCVTNGSITVTASNTDSMVGGFVGNIGAYLANSPTITGCENNITIQVAKAKAVGGFIGGCNRHLHATDSANMGAITGSENVTYAGGFVGYFSTDKTAQVMLKNCLQTGNVTGGNYVGGLVGQLYMEYDSAYSNMSPLYLTGTVVKCEVSGYLYAGGLVGFAYASAPTNNRKIDFKLTSSAMDVTVTALTPDGGTAATTGLFLAGTTISTPADVITVDADSYVHETMTVFAPIDKTKADFTAYTPGTWTDTVMTDGTVVTILNAYATANGYRKWMQGENCPVYYLVALKVNVRDRAYNGEAFKVEAGVEYTIVRDDVASVNAQWYSVVESVETLLDAAPVNAGTYRVKLIPVNAEGTELTSDAVTADFEITKAAVVITVNSDDAFTVDGTTMTATYNGSAINPTATAVSLGTTLTDALAATVTQADVSAEAKEPGAYSVKFSYAEDANHSAAEVTYTLTIGKIKVNYPANVWTVENQGSIGYNGTEQSVTLKDLNTSVYSALYTNNNATSITAAGTYLTATATVTLVDTVHYEFTGDPVTYELEWRMDQGSVVLKLCDSSGNPVDLTELTYDGVERTYYVWVFNTADNKVDESPLATIVVLNAGSYDREYQFAGNDYYQAGSVTISFVVNPDEVTMTQADLDKTYDKSPVAPAPVFDVEQNYQWQATVYKWEKLVDGNYVEISEAPTNAGSYRVTITALTEDGNRKAEIVKTFVISRAQANPSWNLDSLTYDEATGTYYVYYNENQRPITVTTSSDGVITITYNGTTVPRSDAGTYVVSFSQAQSENYEAATLPNITFVIRKLEIVVPAQPWDYDDTAPFDYSGSQKTVQLLQSFLRLYSDYFDVAYDQNSATGAGTYYARAILTLRNTDNIKFSDTDDASKTLPILEWKINKINVDMSGIYFDTTPLTYNGSEQQPALYGVPTSILSYVLSAGKTNVGVGYEITATFTLLDTANYNALTDAQTTLTGRFDIEKATVTITLTGDETVTFDNETHTFIVSAEDALGTNYSRFVTVVITKDGKTVNASDVKNAGTYTYTCSVTGNDNLLADTVVKVLTIRKATYSSREYTVSNRNVKYDGKAQGLLLPGLGVGLDGKQIEMVGTMPTYTEPGVYEITLKFIGSENYEAIPDQTATLTILRTEVKSGEEDGEGEVLVDFSDGLDPTLITVIENAVKRDVDKATLEEIFGKNHSIKNFYSITIVDADGKTANVSGTITVSITVPEKYRDSESLAFVQVTTNKKGEQVVKYSTSTKKSDKFDCKYDPETGVCEFTLTDLSASYGFVTKDNPIPQFAIIGVAVACVGATAAVCVVRAKKSKKEEE